MSYLTNEETEEVFQLGQNITLLSNQPHPELDPDRYKIFTSDAFQTKQAVITFIESKHNIIDICSEATFILRDEEEIKLKPMQFYTLKDDDKILIGSVRFAYRNIIQSDSQIGETQSDEFLKPQSRPLKKKEEEEVFVNGTEEDAPQSQSDEPMPSEPLDDIEIPESQSEGSANVSSPSKYESAIDTQEFFEASQEMIEESFDKKDFKDLVMETQPMYKLPPATRNFARQQNALRPPTRSLAEFEATQAFNMTSRFNMETQPFVMNQSAFVRSNFNSRRPPKKVDPILKSSSESEGEDDDEESQSDMKFKILTEQVTEEVMQVSCATPPPSSSPDMMLQNTPGWLPLRVSTQLPKETLNNVNSSQHLTDDSIVDFKEEAEDEPEKHIVVPLRKRNSETILSLKPKKVKFMKYDSDEEN